MICSTRKCSNQAKYELVAVLEKGTPNRREIRFFACQDCVGYESDAIVSVTKISSDEAYSFDENAAYPKALVRLSLELRG